MCWSKLRNGCQALSWCLPSTQEIYKSHSNEMGGLHLLKPGYFMICSINLPFPLSSANSKLLHIIGKNCCVLSTPILLCRYQCFSCCDPHLLYIHLYILFHCENGFFFCLKHIPFAQLQLNSFTTFREFISHVTRLSQILHMLISFNNSVFLDIWKKPLLKWV